MASGESLSSVGSGSENEESGLTSASRRGKKAEGSSVDTDSLFYSWHSIQFGPCWVSITRSLLWTGSQ